VLEPGKKVRVRVEDAKRYNLHPDSCFEVINLVPGSGTGVLCALLQGGRRSQRLIRTNGKEDHYIFPLGVLNEV